MHEQISKYSIKILGLKSKVNFIMETISNYQPILICLVEGVVRYSVMIDQQIVEALC